MLDFLVNPVNTGITAFTLLAIIGGLGWFLVHRNVSISKDGIAIDNEKQCIDKIPIFDRALQNTLHASLNNSKGVMLAIISESVPSKESQIMVLFAALTVLRYRIRDNHYSMILSSKDLSLKWIDDVSADMALELRYTELYTGIIIGDPDILDCARKIASKQLQSYKSYAVDCINRKLVFYRSLPSSKKTEALIEKNEAYLRGIG